MVQKLYKNRKTWNMLSFQEKGTGPKNIAYDAILFFHGLNWNWKDNSSG